MANVDAHRSERGRQATLEQKAAKQRASPAMARCAGINGDATPCKVIVSPRYGWPLCNWHYRLAREQR